MGDIEQKLQEQGATIKQLVSVGQDCSCRVEEHEFRLGVARTKMDVHDEKISRLEARRWTHGAGASNADREIAVPTSPRPNASATSFSQQEVSCVSSSSAATNQDKWQMSFHDNLAFGAWAN